MKILSTFFGGLLSFSLTAQTIHIRFDWQTRTLPTLSNAKLKYNKDFAYSFTLDDANADGFTTALPLLQGGTVYGTNYPPLQYTDGCGNAVNFKAGIAWNSANRQGVDGHNGSIPSLMTWKQLDDLYRLGWDVMSHSYSHKARSSDNMTSQDYTYEVEQNRVAVKQKTLSRIDMPLFVVPTGDTNYYAPAIRGGHRVVFDQNWVLMGNRGLNVEADIPTNPIKIHRQLLEANGIGMPVLDEVAGKSNSNRHFWYNQFAHRVDDFKNGGFKFNLFKNHMTFTAQKYGKNGSDRMWMAPLQEVYEYLLTRQLIQYSTQFADKNMAINFDLNRLPSWIRRKSITLLVNSAADFRKIEAPQGVAVSFRGVGNFKMINLDFTNWQAGNSTMVTHISNFTGATKGFAGDFDESVAEEVNELSIFNEMGQLVLQKNRDLWEELDISHLPKGMYIVLTRHGNSVSRRKIIKF